MHDSAVWWIHPASQPACTHPARSVILRPQSIMYREKGHQILYDSFGRSQGEGDLNLLSAYNVTEQDAEQPISTDPELQYCGQACIAFGIVCQRKGMKAAKFMRVGTPASAGKAVAAASVKTSGYVHAAVASGRGLLRVKEKASL